MNRKMNKQVEDRKVFYQTLKRKITVLIITVSFFPLIFTTGFLFYKFNLTYTEKIQAHISELVLKHTQNIDMFLAEKLSNIRYLAALLKEEDQDPYIFLKDNLLLLKNEYGEVFTDLGLISETGIQFAYQGPFKLEYADYSGAQWFLEAKKRPYYISDVFAGLRGYPHFIIAVKVKSDQSEYILRSAINFTAFNSLVENIHIGRTGIAFVINRKGQLQTKTDVSLHESVVSEMIQQKCGDENITFFSKKKNTDGDKYLCISSKLKNIDWLMIFRQDMDDAFRDLRRTQILIIGIFLLGCVVITFVSLALPKNIIKLLANADQKSESMNKQVIESGKLATIGELAAGIAHEINNPVAIMVEEAGWIEDLLEEEELKETDNLKEFKRALSQINTQGQRCKEITHKLLSFARKTDSSVNDVQVNDAINEIVSLTAQMAKYNKVSIKTKLNKKIPYIRISPSELQQVILNLINNAIDAMEKNGGTVLIETKISEIKKDHIVITIEDNGPGIPRDYIDRIFDPFFTTKAVGKGTGLGLSICYGIIQRMGGSIDVHSQVGTGTRFRIWIPFQKEEVTSSPNGEMPK